MEMTLFQASVETVYTSPSQGDTIKSQLILGYFKDKKCAEYAIKIYRIAHNKIVIWNHCTENYSVKEEQVQKSLYTEYFDSLYEFINTETIVKKYIAKVGTERFENILKEIKERDVKSENELSIIERMIKDYEKKLNAISITTNANKENVKVIKENIKFLEDLRDGKIEL